MKIYHDGAINYDPSYGLVFTEDAVAHQLIEETNNISLIQGYILEPSFGQGVFIKNLMNYSYDQIDGYEVHKETFNSFNIDKPNVNLYNSDFLLTDVNKKYDFIMGAPPFLFLEDSFYDERTKELLEKNYSCIKDRRLRLMSMFVYKSFHLLKEGGTLSLFLHKTFMKNGNFCKLRKFLYENSAIKVMDYVEGKPYIMLLILQKTKGNNLKFITNNERKIRSDCGCC